MKRWLVILSAFLVAGASYIETPDESPYGSTGEVTKYNFVDGKGKLVDAIVTPIDSGLVRYDYIYDNSGYYFDFWRVRELIDIKGLPILEKLSTYYLILNRCFDQAGDPISWQACAHKPEVPVAVVRKSFGGDFSIFYPNKNERDLWIRIAQNRATAAPRLNLDGFKDRVTKTIAADSAEVRSHQERGKAILAKIAEQKRRAEEERRRKAAEQERQRRVREQQERVRRQNADDREPTEYEMNQAIRSTLAGAIFGANVTKLGRCRKLAPYDYQCRYRYLSVNWGNFWKSNGRWYFKIAN